jgi:hypothetical protein
MKTPINDEGRETRVEGPGLGKQAGGYRTKPVRERLDKRVDKYATSPEWVPLAEGCGMKRRFIEGKG